MDTGEIPLSAKDIGIQRETKLPEIPIPEVDLRGKDLSTVHGLMTQRVQSGNLLHGTPRTDLVLLEPKYSIDTIKGNQTAVFASDQPTIPIARAVGGDNLSLWTRQVIFQVKDPAFSYPDTACIYELPGAEFTVNSQDPSEYLSDKPVRPVAKYIFDDNSIRNGFRTSQEIQEFVSKEGTINPLQVRAMDVTVALLAVRNLLALGGDVAEIENGSKQEEYFLRLPGVIQSVAPILAEGLRIGDDTVKRLMREVMRMYDVNTYDVYNAYNPSIMPVYRVIDPIFQKTLKQ